MNVRILEPEEFGRLEDVAMEFYDSSELLNGFDMTSFMATWKAIYEAKVGVIFVGEVDGEIAGAIGGLACRDPNSVSWTATEMFWFVREPYRRTGIGIELYGAFESWAVSMACERIRMAYLLDVMPEVVKEVYGSLGFKPIEVTYSKELR